MKIGIAADHGGFALKEHLSQLLRQSGYHLIDFGANSLVADDDYPDFILPLARALAHGQVQRAIAVCGSGVGACIIANKVPGVYACLIHEAYSAHQGVEHDNMNMICLGGRTLGQALAWDLTRAFLNAEFENAARHLRRFSKITDQEKSLPKNE